VIARIAGLPADAVERFGTALCAGIAETGRLEAELAGSRAALADRIHELVPGSSPELRRLLLAVRRDCFNGRPIGRHSGASTWAELRQLAGSLVDRVVEGENRTAGRGAEFQVEYDRERDRQRLALLDSLRDPAFARGLALASPDLFRGSSTLHASPAGTRTRAQRKVEVNLLRYVSRAATKLSPFSTFTRIGLATLRRDVPGATVRLRGDGWRARSLVRIKPYLLEKFAAMLRCHEPFRAGLEVVVNNSVTEIDGGRVMYLRPSYWEPDADTGQFSFRAESLVRVGLRGPFVSYVREQLGSARLTYAELVANVEREFSGEWDGARVRQEVDALVRIGFLVLLPPWKVHEGHLETNMLRALRAVPPDDATAPFVEHLERLVGLEEGFASSADPVGAAEEMDRLIDEAWAAVAPLGGVDPESGYARASRYSVYEDVFVMPAEEDSSSPSVADVPRRSAEDALRSVEPLVRLAAVFDHRHDFLHTLDALARDRWPGRREVRLLEVFNVVQPLWHEYIRFRMAAREDGGWRSTWNPLGLPELSELAQHREEAYRGLLGCLRREGDDQRLCGEALTAVLAWVPAAYTSFEAGACMFLQPADAGRGLWMLNRVKEGTGRFGSRFTPAMDEAMRRRYTWHLIARGTREADGERVDLLDLRCVQGDTLNIHPLQTPRVLALPEAENEAPSHRQVRLGDLWVRFGAGRPHLRDGKGRRLLAVQLGFAYEDYLPPLVKFLSLFGPSETSAAFPPPWEEQEGALRFAHRTILGNVVLHRRSWSFPVQPLAEAAAGLDEAGAFAAVNRWRLVHAIPECVFMIERVPHPRVGVRSQPQYVDFTSPLFVALFRSALQDVESMTVTEALPAPGAFPRDGEGRRWAVELVVDSLAMQPRYRRRPKVRLADPASPLLAAGLPG
jgi:hypothetical protein